MNLLGRFFQKYLIHVICKPIDLSVLFLFFLCSYGEGGSMVGERKAYNCV